MNSRRSSTVLQSVQPELACPLCGSDRVTTAWNPLAFDYGSGESSVELTMDVPVHRCEDCEFEYLDEEAERLKHNEVCRHLGVLSPDEIRRIREEAGMTRVQFARLTGIGEASLNRWENGLSIQTHAYDRYLRLLMRPGNMRGLEDSLKSTASLQTMVHHGWGFCAIKMTDSLRKEQKGFRLRRVA